MKFKRREETVLACRECDRIEDERKMEEFKQEKEAREKEYAEQQRMIFEEAQRKMQEEQQREKAYKPTYSSYAATCYFRQCYAYLLEETKKEGSDSSSIETVAFVRLPVEVLHYYLSHIDQKDA